MPFFQSWSNLDCPFCHIPSSSGGTDSSDESHPSISDGPTRGLGSALKAIHCHSRRQSHVTDDRACGILLTPDPETFPLSAPAVANGWPRTSTTTDHWGSFVRMVNHIRQVMEGADQRQVNYDLLLQAVDCGIWV